METKHVYKNSPEEMERLIQENYALVFYMINKHREMYVDFNEAEGYAVEGLFNAARTFDREKGIPFSSYACKCIYNQLITYVRKENPYQFNCKCDLSTSLNNGDELSNLENIESLPDDCGNRPSHLRDPLSLLLEKERTQKVQELVDEASWWGNEYINTFIDHHYHNISQPDLARWEGSSQPNISNRVISFKGESISKGTKLLTKKTIQKEKQIKQFKQQLKAL